MSTISTLNPGLATDIIGAVRKAKQHHPHSGQTATLSTLAMLQMSQAANSMDWGVSRQQIALFTGLSESTVRNHLNYWLKKRVVNIRVASFVGDTYTVRLEA